jgi:hypothetical protein
MLIWATWSKEAPGRTSAPQLQAYGQGDARARCHHQGARGGDTSMHLRKDQRRWTRHAPKHPAGHAARAFCSTMRLRKIRGGGLGRVQPTHGRVAELGAGG